MAKAGKVTSSCAISFTLTNVCNKSAQQKQQMTPASSPGTAAFSWAKDDYAASGPDNESFRVTPYVEGTQYSCLFGTLASKGLGTEEYSEMVTFNGGHEASPSKALFGDVTITPLGAATTVPKFLFNEASNYPGADFAPPPSQGCTENIARAMSARVLIGRWDYGPPAFWYDAVENKIIASHDCWQTVLITGRTAWDSVEYTYPSQRLIKGPNNGYPFKNDVLRAEATEVAYTRDPSTGAWLAFNRFRSGTTTTPLLSLGQRTEIYRVISPYIVDGKEKWEMPPGWPTDNRFLGGMEGPRKFPKSIVTQQPWEIGYLMLDGTLKVDVMNGRIFKPFTEDPMYKPKFVYVEAKLSGDALDIRDSLIGDFLPSMREKLALQYPGIDMSSRA